MQPKKKKKDYMIAYANRIEKGLTARLNILHPGVDRIPHAFKSKLDGSNSRSNVHPYINGLNFIARAHHVRCTCSAFFLIPLCRFSYRVEERGGCEQNAKGVQIYEKKKISAKVVKRKEKSNVLGRRML